MATRKDIQNQKDFNKVLKETEEIEKSLKGLRKADVDTSFSATESLRELLGVKARTLSFDKEILNSSRAISKELLNQETSLSNISSQPIIDRFFLAKISAILSIK